MTNPKTEGVAVLARPPSVIDLRLFWGSMMATAVLLLIVVWYVIIKPDEMPLWQRATLLAMLALCPSSEHLAQIAA